MLLIRGKMSLPEQSSKENKITFFSGMKEFIAPYTGRFALSVILSITGVACSILCYVFVGKIAAELIEGTKDLSALVKWLVPLILCKLLSGVLLNTSTWVSHKAAFCTLADIRSALADKMLRLPLGYFETTGSGRIKAIAVDRVETVEKTLAHMLPELTGNILAHAALVVWAFFIDRRVSLVMVGWMILGLCCSGGMMMGYEQKFGRYAKAEKGMNQAIVEYVGGIEVIKNFNRTEQSYKRITDSVDEHTASMLEWMKDAQLWQTLVMTICPLAIFPTAVFGLHLVQGGSLAVSELFLLLIISMSIFAPLMKASSYIDQIASMDEAAKEVRAILDAPELKRGDGVPDGEGDIEFSHVTFSYDGEVNALDDVSFTVPKGSFTALAGLSGSGKSTIAKLLAGYRDKSGGKILIGTKDISEISSDELNRCIAYVDQETYLYNTTIMENIRVGDPSASDEQVKECAAKCGCDAFISALPQGYDTQAGTAGGRLSGGERQRIAICRAMLKNAPVVILDEATASADPENEAEIQRSLSALCENKTLIVVEHRLSTIKNADNILVMENGKVAESGTHGELIDQKGIYAKLWEISEGGSRE